MTDSEILHLLPTKDSWFSWCDKGDAAIKHKMEDSNSPPRELPSKFQKYRRMKERQDLSHVLQYDEQHSEKINNNKVKCAGTQTPFMTFPPQADYHSNMKPETSSPSFRELNGEQRYILDLDKSKPGSPSIIKTKTLASDATNNTKSQNRSDSDNKPLNLSAHTPSQKPAHRPSVITIAPVNSPRINYSDQEPSSQYMGPMCYGPQHAAVPEHRLPKLMVKQQNDMCDPAIEEHFRRSLGKNYPECLGTPTSPATSPMTSEPRVVTASPGSSNSESGVSISGSVDDHFAKALGEQRWTEIKAKNDPIQSEFMAGSVDDHFAKALGDTWLKIKEEKRRKSSSGDGSPMEGSPAAKASP